MDLIRLKHMEILLLKLVIKILNFRALNLHMMNQKADCLNKIKMDYLNNKNLIKILNIDKTIEEKKVTLIL